MAIQLAGRNRRKLGISWLSVHCRTAGRARVSDRSSNPYDVSDLSGTFERNLIWMRILAPTDAPTEGMPARQVYDARSEIPKM